MWFKVYMTDSSGELHITIVSILADAIKQFKDEGYTIIKITPYKMRKD